MWNMRRTELMILPLTARGIKAKQLPDRSDTLSVLSGLLTFTDKIIDKNYAK